ncbi:MAG: hypothetical protein ABFC84_09765 [Veillonellales bacterium]
MDEYWMKITDIECNRVTSGDYDEILLHVEIHAQEQKKRTFRVKYSGSEIATNNLICGDLDFFSKLKNKKIQLLPMEE